MDQPLDVTMPLMTYVQKLKMLVWADSERPI